MRDLLAQSFNLINLFYLFDPAAQEVAFLRLEKPK